MRRSASCSPPNPRKARSKDQRLEQAAIGCGVDVVELARFRRALARGGRAFVRRVFTPDEEAYAKARHRTTLLHLAGRFAAKEAVIKAIAQIEPRRTLTMKQVEVRNDRLGRPHVVLHAARAGHVQVHISLSHVNSVAVASAIAINSASRNVLYEAESRRGRTRRGTKLRR